ncbi:MAG TPA: hypothetical protein VJ400_06085 [Thermoplasmata archaeon]|nr:hypothetical protein [Thermoplasmata archaeon]
MPSAMETDAPPAGISEVRRELDCRVCRGDWKACRLSTCPYLAEVRGWFQNQGPLASANLFGASPPSAFVGSYGYPKVLAGPLVPPVTEDTYLMDAPEQWVDKDLWDILRFRLTLVRGKAARRVIDARSPDPILRTVQEEAMSERPVDTELWLTKKPQLEGPFSARAAPTGPSGEIRKLVLAENPHVPRRVDYVVDDTDLRAVEGVADLYAHGVQQSHITRVFSVGLLGMGANRKLVPTEWSITAVDDILAKRLLEHVRTYAWIDAFRVLSHTGVGNTVAVLLAPSSWMFEGLEAWHPESNPLPAHDHEFFHGRKDYPRQLEGAYHAVRLPILEYLERERRQAGAVAFLEVYRDWIPLGVWRFRELARAALRKPPETFGTLEEALAAVQRNVRVRLQNWWRQSVILPYLAKQRRIEQFGA